MKLLFILPEYAPHSGGGIISYYQGVLPDLVTVGHEVHVLVTRPDLMDHKSCEVNGVRISYLRSDLSRNARHGFKRYELASPVLAGFLQSGWAAFEQARHGEGFDLVETVDFTLPFAPWIVASHAPPLNVSLHGSCGQMEWYAHSPRPSLGMDLLRLIERSAIASADGVQGNSAANAAFWKHLTNREVRVLLPPLAVDAKIELRSASRPEGIVLGRLERWKGPFVLCRALEEVPDARLRWIGRDVDDGTGCLMSQLLREKYPQIFGRRLIHEPMIDHARVLPEIAEASFLCVPSTWDVFNLTAAEAMAAGTPVICSQAAGASMLIRHGENGYLFDPDNPAALAECIRQVRDLLPAQRADMVERARQTIAEKLNPERLLAERIDYYKELIAMTDGRKEDAWLKAMIDPQSGEFMRSEILKAFTVKELALGTVRQAVSGLKRRLSP